MLKAGGSLRSTPATLTSRLRGTEGSSPIGNLVVLQELTPHVLAGQESGENRVADSGCCVDLIERRTKAEDFGFVLSNRGRILISNPTGIDAIHVDAVSSVILGGRSRQHVEGGFGHVGVRVLVRLVGPVKNALHR